MPIKVSTDSSFGTAPRIVVAVGGDGTVNEVARGLMGTDKIMGILPCGSGDGLARKLGLRVGLKKALDIIRRRKVCIMDCAEIDGKPFFSVCGVGLDAIVSEKFATAGKRGVLTYVEEAVRTWKGFTPGHYEITVDGNTISRDAVLITVANSNQWGNGAKIAPRAAVDDGMLEITLVNMFSTLELPGMVLALMSGFFDKYPRVESFRGREIRIRRSSPGPAHFDGDYMDAGTDISIRLLPSKLKVLVP